MFCIFSCGDDEQPPSFTLDIPIIDRIPDQLKEITLDQKKNIEEMGFVFVKAGEFTMGSPENEIRFRRPDDRDEKQCRKKISKIPKGKCIAYFIHVIL